MKKTKIGSFVMMCCLTLLLLGCGGGGGGGTESDDVATSQFVAWNGNANGTIVLDGNNNPIQFRSSDGSLFDGSTYYNNVENSGSNVLLNGYVIGTISSTTSTTGTTIAVLKCTDGSNMIMSGGNLSCSGSTNNNSGTGNWVTGTYKVVAFGSDLDPLVRDTYLTAFVTTSSGSADTEGQYIKISNWSWDYTAGYSVEGHSGTLNPRESKIINIPFNNGSGSSYRQTEYQLSVQYYKEK